MAFYEPRERLEDNAALKRALREMSKDLPSLEVLAVGDVSSFDFDPARSIVRRVVRVLGARHDLEVLLDWRGALTAPPLSLTRGVSNVVLIDATGQVHLRREGVLRGAEIAAFCDEVRACVRALAQST